MQRREKSWGKEVGRVVGEGEKMRKVERSVSGRSGSSYSGIGGGRRGRRLVVVEMKVVNEGSMYIYMDNGRKILELDGKCEMWYKMMMEMVEKEGKEWMW